MPWLVQIKLTDFLVKYHSEIENWIYSYCSFTFKYKSFQKHYEQPFCKRFLLKCHHADNVHPVTWTIFGYINGKPATQNRTQLYLRVAERNSAIYND